MKTIVLALDALVNDPDIIKPNAETPKIADVLVIPASFLDKIYEFYHETSTRGDACKELNETLNHLKLNRNNRKYCILENGTRFEIVEVATNRQQEKTTQQVIAVAKELKRQNGGGQAKYGEIAILTSSSRLPAIVQWNGINCISIYRETPKGRRKVVLPMEYSNEWYSNHRITAETWSQLFPNEAPLKYNEFVEFVPSRENGVFMGEFDDEAYYDKGYLNRKDPKFDRIGRFDTESDALIPLKYFDKAPGYYNIHPSNAGQAMLMEALMAPAEEIPIVVVSGTFGTGKTFLTVASGIIQVEGNGRPPAYERIFVCPPDRALGRQIGYLPGDVADKVIPSAKPIIDNLREVLKLRKMDSAYSKKSGGNNGDTTPSLDKKVENYLDNMFEFEAILNMGGRTLSDTFIIYDEFQDTERGQAKALLTRIGNDSKMVIMGDPNQFTNPHLSPTSNGLAYVTSRIYGSEYGAIITLGRNEIVRSAAARAIAELF